MLEYLDVTNDHGGILLGPIAVFANTGHDARPCVVG